MATHTGKAPVSFVNKPIDPQSVDWVYFIYDDWLNSGEYISEHSGLATGGVVTTDSVQLSSYRNNDGKIFYNVFAVQVSGSTGSNKIILTHRVSTTVTGGYNLSRINIDHTVIIPISTL